MSSSPSQTFCYCLIALQIVTSRWELLFLFPSTPPTLSAAKGSALISFPLPFAFILLVTHSHPGSRYNTTKFIDSILFPSKVGEHAFCSPRECASSDSHTTNPPCNSLLHTFLRNQKQMAYLEISWDPRSQRGTLCHPKPTLWCHPCFLETGSSFGLNSLGFRGRIHWGAVIANSVSQWQLSALSAFSKN